VEPSNTPQPPITQIEGPATDDVEHEMVCAHSHTTGIDHETSLPTVTDQPTHTHNNDQDLATADISHMISRNSVELQASSPGKNLPMTPVQQIPSRPHTQHTSSDFEDHTTQADEQGKPMDRDEGHTIPSDDEPHQSHILGNPKKPKKLKTERESSKYRDRTRSRSRHTTSQEQ